MGLVQMLLNSNNYFAFASPYAFDTHAFTFLIVGRTATTRQPLNAGSVTLYQFMLSSTADTLDMYCAGAGLLALVNGGIKTSSIIPTGSLGMFGMVLDSGSSNAYVNGVKSAFSSPAVSASTSAVQLFGYGPDARPWQGSVKAVFGYDRALTDVELGKLLAYANSLGVPNNPAKNVVASGDSITYGAVTTLNRGWYNDWLPRGVLSWNRAQGGDTIASLQAQYSTYDANQYIAGKDNICIIFAGTNDIYLNGDSAATAYGNLQSYCSQATTTGYKVVVITMLPRGSPYESVRESYNNLIYAGFSAGTLACVALVDVAGNLVIGQAGQNSNTTYYNVDGVHPNNAGHAIIAGMVANTFSGLPQISLADFNGLTGLNFIASASPGHYFTIYGSPSNAGYYLWFSTGNGETDPAPAGLTGIQVVVSPLDAAQALCGDVISAISGSPYSNVWGLTNVNGAGTLTAVQFNDNQSAKRTNATDVNTGASVETPQQGNSAL